jgi:hypothetical protein
MGRGCDPRFLPRMAMTSKCERDLQEKNEPISPTRSSRVCSSFTNDHNRRAYVEREHVPSEGRELGVKFCFSVFSE